MRVCSSRFPTRLYICSTAGSGGGGEVVIRFGSNGQTDYRSGLVFRWVGLRLLVCSRNLPLRKPEKMQDEHTRSE